MIKLTINGMSVEGDVNEIKKLLTDKQERHASVIPVIRTKRAYRKGGTIASFGTYLKPNVAQEADEKLNVLANEYGVKKVSDVLGIRKTALVNRLKYNFGKNMRSGFYHAIMNFDESKLKRSL